MHHAHHAYDHLKNEVIRNGCMSLKSIVRLLYKRIYVRFLYILLIIRTYGLNGSSMPPNKFGVNMLIKRSYCVYRKENKQKAL